MTAANARRIPVASPTIGRRAGFRRRRAAAPVRALLLAASLLAAAPATAERADRNKPITVEADSMSYDDLKQVNVFSGNVTLTKGTILIRADRLVLRQDAEGYQYGTATGNPASFRQKREGLDQFIAAAGRQIDYDGKSETVKIQQKANLKRLEKERVVDEVHGSLIVYDSRSEFFTVEGGGPASATPENPTGRVRVVIQPREAEQPAAGPAPLAPAQRLEPSRR